ncbi:MAG TPA: hypothetical protein VMT35_14415 [Ignavibacteriaceae bacterium]|nr:hypothetical protein [Ignavibacteriaceae bacterium]
MLGDFAHGHPLPYISLIFLLDKWIDKVSRAESKNYNIALILEADTQEVAKLSEFIESGNWEPFIDYWLPYNTMEWLEFCAELRSLKLHIDSLNTNKHLPAKISFNIFGGEPYNNFDYPQSLQLSEEEGLKYFVQIRDSLSAKNIIEYLKNNNRKAILFYGNLHLIKNYVSKNIAGALPDSESYGYYLAYYLKKEFGQDSVLTINQRFVNESTIKNSPFAAAKDSNIFVYSKDIPWSNLRPENFDGYILRHEQPSPARSLSYIFSKNVITADIKRMQFINEYLPGYLAKGYYGKAEESLKLLTGKNYNSINQWSAWIKNNNYDGFLRLESNEFKNDIYKAYYEDSSDQKTKLMLLELGFGPGIMQQQLISKEEWENVWKEVLPQIKYLNEVGLLWIGTAEEKQKAERYLSAVVGGVKVEERLEPQDYLKLFRKHYWNVNY